MPETTGLRAAGAARTRRNILDATRRHLVEAGFHRLSLEQVAADAGVTRVTVYRRFGSKLGLLDAVAEDVADRARVVVRMRRAAETPDPVSAFRTMVAELCRFWSVDPIVLRRLISLAAVDPEAREVLEGRDGWRYERVAEFVRRLDADGRLRTGFDLDQAVAAVGVITGFPACDELATRLGARLDTLDRMVIPLLAGVVRLD
ncbi:TetR/AcrR family transcriptional regulator [Amycolatopsis sp. CA-230715]|uniref:TetR/AcrR family transcriptional regulator n=1 Tax=Amycolatopsis sp. CA-230715 TaxID=2745196 RepID=UPI001C01C4B1|nr:TetR/AcrR family transcriptional regulator [Amycolatopsis sp. CA-230715]QWF85005.1 hypothetical protein HUW46_08458 [Amycolatopsis sp. CA-230715]